MHWSIRVRTLLLMGGLVVWIATLQAGQAFGGCGCSGAGVGLFAPACGAPGYGASGNVAGCCECQPKFCDHVWDGYCENKGWWWRSRGSCAAPCGGGPGCAAEPPSDFVPQPAGVPQAYRPKRPAAYSVSRPAPPTY